MEGAVSVPETRVATVPEGSRLLSRELSWLAFNERVLEEAADPRWPLLERVKFLAIFYSNLDEFFMIRVAGLHTLLEQGEDGPGPDGLTAREQLDRIGIAVRRLVRSASALLSGELLPALEEAGIRLHRRGTLEAEARARTADYFHSTVFPVLTPVAAVVLLRGGGGGSGRPGWGRGGGGGLVPRSAARARAVASESPRRGGQAVGGRGALSAARAGLRGRGARGPYWLDPPLQLAV